MPEAPIPRDLDLCGGSSAGAEIVLRGVEKSFGSQAVLRGLDLTIASGQFVAVVGRSGCGKSTLLRLIAGLDTPDHGDVLVCGAPARLGQHSRIMFQEPRLLPWSRVAANAAVGLPDPRRGTERVQEALAQVGLAARAQDWPGVLSGGQKQRVALARALLGQPRLLALDEPLGALDALTRIEMQRLIESFWRAQNFTTVLVTHDVDEAVALADRVLVLEQGRIAEDISVALERPRRHGDAEAAGIAGEILRHLLQEI